MNTTSALLTAAILASCGGSPSPSSTATTESSHVSKPNESPTPLYALSYVAGPGWKKDKGPQEQDLGGHFQYVDGLFKRGTLVANGLYQDEVRGLYVFSAANEAEVRAIANGDPGVENGTLQVDTIAPWLVAWDGLDAPPAAGAQVFVLEYGPGMTWKAGHSAMEQDLASHFEYVTRAQQRGQLFAAGPLVGTDRGRYIISVGSKAEAESYVSSDPGIRAHTVVMESMRPWTPLNRQSQASAARHRAVR